MRILRMLLPLWLVLATAFMALPCRADDGMPLKVLRIVDVRIAPGEMKRVVNDLRRFATSEFLASRVEETWRGVSVRLHAMNLTAVGGSGGDLGTGTLRLIAYDGVYSAAGEGLAAFDSLVSSICVPRSVCNFVASAESDSRRGPWNTTLPSYGVIDVTMPHADREDIINLVDGFLYAKGFVERSYGAAEGLVTEFYGLQMTVITTARLSGPTAGLRIAFTDGPIAPSAGQASAFVAEVANVIASRPAATVVIAN
jgi:hypothetical protein